MVPDAEGALARVLLGIGDGSERFVLGALSGSLPEGDCAVEGLDHVGALGWALGTYDFRRYRTTGKPEDPPRLRAAGLDLDEVARQAEAVAFVRDPVNTPANDPRWRPPRRGR